MLRVLYFEYLWWLLKRYYSQYNNKSNTTCTCYRISFSVRCCWYEADTGLNLRLSVGNGKWNPWIEFNSIQFDVDELIFVCPIIFLSHATCIDVDEASLPLLLFPLSHTFDILIHLFYWSYCNKARIFWSQETTL